MAYNPKHARFPRRERVLPAAMNRPAPRRSPWSTRHAPGWPKPLLALLLLSLACPSISSTHPGARAAEDRLAPILKYIDTGWDTLTRSLANCDTIVDPKMPAASVLYFPARFPEPAAVQQLEKQCRIHVQQLPLVIRHPGEINPVKLDPPGLLYLENRYVVPGGRFNEMYGWDSYFIIRGLLQDGRVDLAQGMVENFFFEIEHYGAVLNANRTYYLTRSQPPFLTSTVLAVYDAQKAAGHEDRAWLAKAYNSAVKDYELWTHEPHLAGTTGLSRYYDFGDGPAPESLQGEPGYYRKVAAFFFDHPDLRRAYLVEQNSQQPPEPPVGGQYDVRVCDAGQAKAKPECESVKTIALSGDFYRGDRAMRESGFDISFRFGPYGAATHHYAPVCLNSLLYKSERDLARMSEILGRKEDTEKWQKRGEDRKEKIQKYLWDSQRGLFFDYDFEKRAQSSYEYATTFYPLWAGLATPEEARAVLQNAAIFEQPGGLVTSRRETGAQWDFPYAWAPIQLLAVEGMRRYGFNDEANRISYEFLSMVEENFRRDTTIREKYNAVTRSSETQVSAGYQANVVGFGWTNGVFLELLHQLPRDWVARLAKDAGE
ncbi:MAG: trehalase family glycosidase [Candidatus Acidiferrales bacterium]